MDNNSIYSKYENAFQTFFDYIQTFLSNKIDVQVFSDLFSTPFSISTINNPVINLVTLDEVVGFYQTVRNTVYPSICQPETFLFFRLNKLAFTPLSDSTVMIAQQYVWFTTPDETARYIEAFSYLLRQDNTSGEWLMTNLIEFHSDFFPDNWIPAPIPSELKYDQRKKIGDLEILVAPQM